MTAEKEKVLSRIRKMLALANDAAASEGERDNALRMIQATLARHNLSMADAEGTPEEERIELKEDAKAHNWQRQLAYHVAKLYFCQYFYSYRNSTQTTTHHYIGKESNAITAKEMVDYLCKSIKREASKTAKQFGETSQRFHRSFAKGATLKIQDRCRELIEQRETAQPAGETGTAMVLASLYKRELEANEAFVKDKGHKLETGRGGNNSDAIGHALGQRYGSTVGLNNQVGSNAARPLAIGFKG